MTRDLCLKDKSGRVILCEYFLRTGYKCIYPSKYYIDRRACCGVHAKRACMETGARSWVW